jgi:hypothetical protein
MSTQAALFECDLNAPRTWRVPRSRGACGRDPGAGPGSCSHWWEGCPDAERRGCWQHWVRSLSGQRYMADVLSGLDPAVWERAA